MTYPYADQFQQSAIVLPPPQSSTTTATVARSISFVSPIPSGLPERPVRHEQYYSNPKVAILSPATMLGGGGGSCSTPPSSSLSSFVSNSGKNDYASMPIDLTKPRLDDAMQQYLTERAFRDSKIKQTQVYRPSAISQEQQHQSHTLGLTVTSTCTLTMSSSGAGLLSTVGEMTSSDSVSSTIVSSTLATTPVATYQAISVKRNIGLLTTFPPIKEVEKRVPTIDMPPNSFDALKNSPNPSKVSYVKVSHCYIFQIFKGILF